MKRRHTAAEVLMQQRRPATVRVSPALPHLPLYPTAHLRTVLGSILLEGPLRVVWRDTRDATEAVLYLEAGDSAAVTHGSGPGRALYYTATGGETRTLHLSAAGMTFERLTGRPVTEYWPDIHRVVVA